METKKLINQLGTAPHIHLQGISLPSEHMRRLPRKLPKAGQADNTKSIGSPFVDKGMLRALLQDLHFVQSVELLNG